jgi:hypothetical protein
MYLYMGSELDLLMTHDDLQDKNDRSVLQDAMRMHRSCQDGISEDVKAVSLLSPFLLARCFHRVVCWLILPVGMTMDWNSVLVEAMMHTKEIKTREILPMTKELVSAPSAAFSLVERKGM